MPPAEPASFAALLDLEFISVGEDEAIARILVHDGVRQPMGLVHGGVYASGAEELCVEAASRGLPEGAAAHAISTTTNFLRPIFEGTIGLAARRRHRGRTTQVWEVDVLDDAARVCAIVRVVLAIRG